MVFLNGVENVLFVTKEDRLERLEKVVVIEVIEVMSVLWKITSLPISF